MAIVLLITGLVVAVFVAAFLSWDTSLKHAKTRENMSIVADALSAFAARNYRIPCPADPSGSGVEPFGYEIGSGATGAALGTCDDIAAGEAEGIVPFQTLGLGAEAIRDGWGRYFTYQVTPPFTRDPEDTSIKVHARCRTTDWIEGVVLQENGGDRWLDGGRNIEPLKARFCCPEVEDDERTIIFSSPAPADVPATIFVKDPDEWYEETDVLVDHYDDHSSENGITPNDGPDPVTDGVGAQAFYSPLIYGGGIATALGTVFGYTDMPVYVLISHGENGAGAFLGDGTLNRIPGGGVSEQQNADATDQRVRDLPRNDSTGAAQFDDIVFWQNQTDMLARLRHDTCVLP